MKMIKISYPLSRNSIGELLSDYGITPTKQRVEIAEYLFQSPQHLSADQILEGISKEGKRVSRATIYNTLGLFASKELVREVLIDRDRVFYDSNNGQHSHIYNVDTGSLSDIDNTAIDLQSITELSDDLRIVDMELVLKVSSK